LKSTTRQQIRWSVATSCRRTTSQSLPTPTTRSIRATKVSKLCALLAPCRTW
jgi:hypothetical protein